MLVGITGGIGSGKSYICKKLQQKGYPVYVCDDEAKRLMQQDEKIRRRLTSLIGPQTYISGQLNKKVIADYLFANKENARNINDIVHPAVLADMKRWYEQQSQQVCFVESAILIEAGFYKETDSVIMIYADEQTRLQRAMQRDNASEEAVKHRMNQQASPPLIRLKSDYVLNNSNAADTEDEIIKMIRFIRTKQTKY